MAKTFKNFIGGKWVAPATGRYFQNRNPADTNDLIGRFPESGKADIDAAVKSAREGYARWSRTPAPERGLILRRTGDLLTAQKDEIAREMTRRWISAVPSKMS